MPEMKYKRVQKSVPHCGDCEEELRGNGSIVMPYNCSCGEWEVFRDRNSLEYKIKDKTN